LLDFGAEALDAIMDAVTAAINDFPFRNLDGQVIVPLVD
jgi:hypothetical protein